MIKQVSSWYWYVGFLLAVMCIGSILLVRPVKYSCGHIEWRVYGISPAGHSCPLRRGILFLRVIYDAQELYYSQYSCFAGTYEELTTNIGTEVAWLQLDGGLHIEYYFGERNWVAVVRDGENGIKAVAGNATKPALIFH